MPSSYDPRIPDSLNSPNSREEAMWSEGVGVREKVWEVLGSRCALHMRAVKRTLQTCLIFPRVLSGYSMDSDQMELGRAG